MKKHVIIAAALAFTAPTWAAAPRPADPASSPEVSIPFADRLRFDDYKPVDNQTVYLRLQTGQWYRAIVSGCTSLTKGVSIGYRVNSDGSFDRNSSLHVDGMPCPVESLVESGPPPARKMGSDEHRIWVPGV